MTRTGWMGLMVGMIGLLGGVADHAVGSSHGSSQVTLATRAVSPALAGAIQGLTAWESTVKPGASTARRCPTGHEFTYVIKGQLLYPPQYPRDPADERGEVTPGGYLIRAWSPQKSGVAHAGPGTSWVGMNNTREDVTVLTIGLCELANPPSTTGAILELRRVDLRGATPFEMRLWEATIGVDDETGRHCHVGEETTYMVKGRMRYHSKYKPLPGDRPVEAPPNQDGAVLTPGKIVHLEPGKVHNGNNKKVADDPQMGLQSAVVFMVSLYPKGSPARRPPRNVPLDSPDGAADFAKCHE